MQEESEDVVDEQADVDQNQVQFKGMLVCVSSSRIEQDVQLAHINRNRIEFG
jgi:hypothetical protein